MVTENSIGRESEDLLVGDVLITNTTSNRLDLANGDSLNLINGSYQIGNIPIFESDRDVAIDLQPNASGTLDLGSATRLWSNLHVTTLNAASFSGANHSHQNSAGGGTLDHGLALTGLGDDDHPQYQLRSERNAASGYAGLTAGTKLNLAHMQEVMALADLSDVTGKSGTGTVAIMQNTPTILTPAIASFTNAQHTHASAAQGGPIAHSSLTGMTSGDPHTQYQLRSEKGVASGYASLDGGGKVPVGQLPNSIMQYQGTWNASTNTPTLADGAGNADDAIGNVYRVSVAGTQNLGSGSIAFEVSDYAILNASKVWEKADTTDAVSSVNGMTGAVVLDSDDVSEGSTNRYFTDERAQDAIGLMIADTATIDLTYTDGTPELKADVKLLSLTDAYIAAANKDGTAGTFSMRTLGTGAQQAAAGNDSRLSDARTPTAHALTHEPGGSDPMAVDAAAATGSLRTLGTGALQATAGNDARLSDSRTPTAHKLSHQDGGSDEISVAGLSGLLADAQTPLAHAASHQPGGGDAMAVDAAAATGSLRTLGTGALQAAAGNHTHASGGITDFNEAAQDAVGGILLDSATIDFTYDDATPSITAIVIDDSISNSKLRNSVGLSVIGRSANSTGDPADIIGTAGQVLRVSGTTLGFGTVATAGIADNAVTFAKFQDIATDRLLGRDTAGAGDVEELTVGGGIEFTGSGGIRTTAFTGDVTKTAGGTALSIAANAVTNVYLRDSAALSVIGRSVNSSGDPADIAGTDGQVLRVSGTALGFGSILSSSISGFTEDVQDIAGGMVSGNSEDGVSVTYDDPNGKLDFANTDKGSTAIATHLAASDPHTQYLLATGARVGASASSQVFTLGITLSNITAGSILFAGASGLVAQDNTNFFFDDATNQLRLAAIGSAAGILIGGDAPIYRAATAQLAQIDTVITTGASGARLSVHTPEALNNFADVSWTTSATGGSASTQFLGHIRATVTQADPSALKSQLAFYVNSGDSALTAAVITDAGRLYLPVVGSTAGLLIAGSLLYSEGSLDLRTDSRFAIIRSGATDAALVANYVGSGNSLFTMRVDGKMEWGAGGGSAVDTALYRSAIGDLTASGKILLGTQATATTDAVRADRDLIAGSGLTGGGNLTADRTFNVGAGDGISVAADSVAVDSTVVRTSRILTAGTGLTGGGDLSADRTFNVGAGDGISVAADSVAVNSTVVRTTRLLTAGAGLTGGGDLSADRTFTVGAGTLITVGADDVGLSVGSAADQFIATGATPFTPAYRAITTLAGAGLTTSGAAGSLTLDVGAGDGISVAAHAVAVDSTVVRTTRLLTAGSGLTGGGDLSADRTFVVGQGVGITVNADDVAVDQAFSPTWTGTHIFQDTKFVIVDVTTATKRILFDVTGTASVDGTLQTTFTTAKTLIFPDAADTLVGKATTDALTNKTLTSTTNNVAAKRLHSATTVIDVVSAAAPSAGQALIATSSTAATWQDIATQAELDAHIAAADPHTGYLLATGARVGASSASQVFTNGVTLSNMTAGSLLFAGAAGVVAQDNANLFFDNANNRLGIGTNAPAYSLHVINAAATTTLGAGLASHASRDSTQGKTWVWGNNILGAGAKTDFGIGNHSDSAVPLLTIQSGGNVGIGTTGPRAKLEAHDSAVNAVFAAGTPSTWRVLQVRNDQGTNSGSASGIAFQGNNVNDDSAPAGIVGIHGNTSGGVVSLAFLTSTGNATSERMRIDSLGNVGIGTSPSFRLHVTGGDIALGTAGSNIRMAPASGGAGLTTSSDDLVLYAGPSSEARLWVKSSNGYIGIGGSPGYALHIAPGSADPEFGLQDSGANATRAYIKATNTYVAFGNTYSLSNVPILFVAAGATELARFGSSTSYFGINVGAEPSRRLHVKDAVTTVGYAQVLIEGAQSGYGAGISMQAPLGTSGVLTEMARIVADGEDSWQSTDSTTQVARLNFYTTLDGTSALKMSLDAAGNLGVGVTTPTAHLNSWSSGTKGLVIAGATNHAAVKLVGAAGAGLFLATNGSSSYLYSVDNAPLIFGVNNAEKMSLTTAGQLTLPTTGSGAGILIGTDVQLYRSGSTQGTITGSLMVPDGSSGSPSLGFSASNSTGFYRITAGTVGFSNLLGGGDGSAANPTYGWANDGTSGMYRSGAGEIGWAVSGGLVARLNAMGFGIGISPTAPLHIIDNGANGFILERTSAVARKWNQLITSDGFWNLYDQTAASIRMAVDLGGQLRLPVIGSGAGILIGGDTNLYRSSIDVLATDDTFISRATGEYIRLGIDGPSAEASIIFGSLGDTKVYRGAADRLDLASGDSMRFVSGHLELAEITAPGTPGAGFGRFYTKTDGKPYWKNDAGTEYDLSAAAASGTVTSVSVVSANGLAGTVATATTTPAITLSTTITGVLKGNGTSISAAVNSDLPVMSATVGGAVPTPPNNTTTFLRGDGTFATPPGSLSGTGVAGRLSYWNGTSSLTSDSNLLWDETNNYLVIHNSAGLGPEGLFVGTSGPILTEKFVVDISSEAGAAGSSSARTIGARIGSGTCVFTGDQTGDVYGVFLGDMFVGDGTAGGTITNSATLYVKNALSADSNVTVTNPYAVWVDEGKVRFDGNMTVGGLSDFTSGSTFNGGVTMNSHLTFNDAMNIVLNTSNGTKIGTGTTQKLGFYNATPVTQRSAITTPTAPGTIYSQSEAQAMKTAVDAIRQVLIDMGITA